MKKFLSVLFILLILSVMSFGADTDIYNVGTVINLKSSDQSVLTNAANAVAYYETATSITYIYKCTIAGDSTNQFHSKPFFIADCNNTDAFCSAIASATSDVNPIYHFSFDDRNTWYSITPATLDAVSNSAKTDTIGIEAGVNDGKGFHTGLWMIVEFNNGSTACTKGDVITWVATFTKDAYFTNLGSAWTPLARVAYGSNTNP